MIPCLKKVLFSPSNIDFVIISFNHIHMFYKQRYDIALMHPHRVSFSQNGKSYLNIK